MGRQREAAYYDAVFQTSRAYGKPATADGPWAAVWAWAANQAASAREVLDVGCGPGHLASLLTARGIRVVGVDFSEVAIAQARIRAPEATFHVGSVPEALTTIPHNADTVTCCEFLEHIENDREVLAALSGLPVIATLPLGDARGHVRHFRTAESVTARYGVVPTLIGKHHWGILLNQ